MADKSPVIVTDMKMKMKSFSVAPMMKHTNRHFRYFWRLISKQSIVFTEMVMADRIVELRYDKLLLDRYLDHDSLIESPLILQLGGNDPLTLKQATRIAIAQYNIHNINLNCGCPSNTVASTHAMGAALMLEPMLTAQCCRAIHEALTEQNSFLSTSVHSTDVLHHHHHRRHHQLSVKCRIGVEDQDSYEDLHHFIHTVHTHGCVNQFYIHARKALLNCSTMENRDVPPLNYSFVYRLIRDFPDVEFIVNGGLQTLEDMDKQFRESTVFLDKAVNRNDSIADNSDGMSDTVTIMTEQNRQQKKRELMGVMVGRACVNHPYMWIHLDNYLKKLNDSNNNNSYNINEHKSNNQSSGDAIVLSRGEILEKYRQYCQLLETQQQRRLNISKQLYSDSELVLDKESSTSSSSSYSDEDDMTNDQKLIPSIILAPIYNLFVGEEYCTKFQRKLKKLSNKISSPSLIISAAVSDMPKEVLYGRRGEYHTMSVINNSLHEKMKKMTGPMQPYIY